ncbi:MAG TPA: magnesium transporter CorA family protein [Mycobacteriales bacterium]|nr:magnesium transporter CorA family protein [Mycobacteriales bacterium]
MTETVVPACRAKDGTRCVAHTRAYRGGQVVEEGFDVQNVSDHLAVEGTVVWLDLFAPDEADLSVLVEELGLHPLAVEDALHESQRPKLDRYEDHLFLSAYAVRFDTQTALLDVEQVSAFITTNALVTVRRGDALPLTELLGRWDGAHDEGASGVAFLLHGLLDLLVDSHFAAVQDLDDQLDAIEETLFDAKPRSRELQRRSFQVRKSLVLLRRVVLPMREVVNALLRRDLHVVDDTMQPYYQDVYDHVLRVSEWTESLRDLISTILETNLTLQGNRLNEVMRSLAAGAALLAVTTAVTGFYGQNVPSPGYGDRSGFIVSTVLLVGITGGLYLLLKKRGWL